MLQELVPVQQYLIEDFCQEEKGVQSSLIMPRSLGMKREVHSFEKIALDSGQFQRDDIGQQVLKIPLPLD